MFDMGCDLVVVKWVTTPWFFTHNPLNVCKKSCFSLLYTYFSLFVGRFYHILGSKNISVILSFSTQSTWPIKTTTLINKKGELL
jgi:hypothetical protein